MQVRLNPDTELRLKELASQSGCPTDELVEDAITRYLAEMSEVRSLLDSRYDEIKSRPVDLVDGETFFKNLRQRENELLK